MALRIADLTNATSFVGTDEFEFSLAGAAGSRKSTGSNLRKQLFAGGTGFTATDPLTCGIITAVGNSTITGTLGGVTTLTCTTVTATNLGGTLSTAAQPNVTSVGALTALTISGALTYGGVALSAAVTGTGSMVLSASPTFTGTITAAAITASGLLTLTQDRAIRFNNQTSAAGANTGTLTNSPRTGNPTHWLKVNVGGTDGAIPFWAE